MNNQPVILAIDQGTTSTRAILFSATLEILAVQQKELKLHYSRKGWVEQNPEAIWEDTLEVCHAVLGHNVSMVGLVAAIGITNQRETTICGIVKPASLFILPLSGRIVAPILVASN